MEDLPENELLLLPGEIVQKDEICSIALGLRCVLTNFRFIVEHNKSFRELVQKPQSKNPQKIPNFPEINLKPFRCSVPLTSISYHSSPDQISTEAFKVKRKDASSVFMYFDSVAKAQVWSQAVHSIVYTVNVKNSTSLTKTFAFINKESSKSVKNKVKNNNTKKTNNLPKISLPEIKNQEFSSSSENSPSNMPLASSPENSENENNNSPKFINPSKVQN